MIEWIHDQMGFFLIFVLACLLSFVGFMAMKSNDNHKRLMVECMKDRKEYECYSMLKQNTSSTIIPVVAPVRVGK
jgi:deoxyhypusine synthase